MSFTVGPEIAAALAPMAESGGTPPAVGDVEGRQGRLHAVLLLFGPRRARRRDQASLHPSLGRGAAVPAEHGPAAQGPLRGAVRGRPVRGAVQTEPRGPHPEQPVGRRVQPEGRVHLQEAARRGRRRRDKPDRRTRPATGGGIIPARERAVSEHADSPREPLPEKLIPAKLRSEEDQDRVTAAAWFAQGRVLQQREDYAGALRCFQRAWRWDSVSTALEVAGICIASHLNE